jgi:serine/threonine protein kinase
MKRLRQHPNILTLRAVAYVGQQGAEQEAFLLLDLCRESLVDHLRAAGGALSDNSVLTIFLSVCRAVSAMHHQSPPLSHRYMYL